MNPTLRRLLRPSLRELMVAVLVFGGALGWLAYDARVQRFAVVAIREAGGWVEYGGPSESERGKPGPSVARARGPAGQRPQGPVVADLIETVTSAGVEGVDDALLGRVLSLTRLKSLYLGLKDGPTFTGIDGIARLSRLQDLVVSGQSADAFSPYLGGLTDLRHLRIYQAQPTDADFARIARLPHLEELTIGGGNLTVEGFSRIASAKSLRHLSLGDCRFDDLSALSGLKNLETVRLSHAPGSSRTSLEPFRGSGLKRLVLSGLLLDRGGLEPVAGLSKLGILVVEERTLTEADLAPIAGFPALGRLELLNAPISTLEPLSPILPKLHFLKITGSSLTDKAVRALRPCKQLVSLDLQGAPITDDGVTNLGRLINLTHLNLADTRLSDAGLDSLQSLKYLEQLTLTGTGTTASGRERLAAAKPGLKIEFVETHE